MRRVLSVGQCAFDHSSIARHLNRGHGAEVIGAETFHEALATLRGERFDLVLVNRVSDADGSSGIDLIRTLKNDPALASIPVMLVSNYADAQQQAEALGALPGFGKSEIQQEKAQQRLGAVLADHPTQTPSN